MIDPLRRLALCWAVIAAALVGCSSDDDPQVNPDTTITPDAGVDTTTTPDAALTGIEVPDLSAPVKALYDEHGILHLRCKTDADCAAALGYFHAANRFFFMDFLRSYIRGKLAEMFALGNQVLPTDYATRHFMTTADGEPLEEASLALLDAADVELLQRYADGVNAWLADLEAGENGAVRPREYDFLFVAPTRTIPQWTPADTIAVALYMLNDLSYTVDEELAGGEIAAAAGTAIDADFASDLLSVRPAFQTFTKVAAEAQPVSRRRLPKLDLARFAGKGELLRRARQNLAPMLKMPRSGGSNNWVVGPARASGDNALLANDPHLALLNPAIWFPVEIDAKSGGTGTLHAAGGSIPGLPVVVIGRTENIAWGLTVVYYDLNEVYLEQLSEDNTKVILDGNEVALMEKTFTFQDAASGNPVQQTFQWVPHHGPLVSVDTENHTGVSVRWVLHEGLTDVTAFFKLMRTARVPDVPAALDKVTALNQNIVVADIEGNIGWFPYSKVPKRPWASASLPPWLPVPGDGTAEWTEYIAMSDLPQLQNPANGTIATANQGLTGITADGNPFNDGGEKPVAYQAWGKAMGARMSRIIELLEEGGSTHDVDSLLAIQSDVHSLVGETITPALITAAAGATLDADTTKVVTALENWQYTCPTGLATSDPAGAKDADATAASESIGCTAFHVTFSKLLTAAFGDEVAAAGTGLPSSARYNLLLTAFIDPDLLNYDFWDDISTGGSPETRDDILVRALIAAGEDLVAWQSAADDWRWGRLHTVSLASPLGLFGSGSYDEGPFANDGGFLTVDVANPSGLGGAGVELPQRNHGASLRMVVELDGAGMTMKWQMPGGTNMNPSSSRYNQFLPLYLENDPIDFPFGPSAVALPDEELNLIPAAQ